jgi:tyrosinase
MLPRWIADSKLILWAMAGTGCLLPMFFVMAGTDQPLNERLTSAQPKTRIRYDARSADGQKMLAIYAKAVSKMKATNVGDPKSWVFQWYSHWVKNDPTDPSNQDAKWKNMALMQIYPTSMPKPAFDLATEVWNGCQAHGDGMDENMFLPWHRMFLCHFEDIIRVQGGDDSFTLPYWNYSVADPAIRGVMPPEFRKKNDPVFGSLYIEARNPGVNMGTPIQQLPEGNPGDPLSTDILAACFYEDKAPITGFCSGIDSTPHGSVHVQIGGVVNMGNVPWAANDPIFWLHHSNIDRLWASWNAAGRKNPALTGKFAFADKNGNRIVTDVADYLDVAKQGYAYDKLETVPDCPMKPEKILAAVQNQKKVGFVKNTPIKLLPGPTPITLDPVAPSKDEEPKLLRA